MNRLKSVTSFLIALASFHFAAHSQICTELGQTPATAFPVCGTTVFHQNSVPICATTNIFVPGCSNLPGGASYQNKNPFFYKFTCYVSGTLGFLIVPLSTNEDYDWQLWDITGHNPQDIFTDNTLVVTGNWAGTYGNTGASGTGVNFIQCASIPANNAPTFAAMPNLTAGHEYILMISHFTNGQSGYDLSFGGGTGVITDPQIPAPVNVMPDCNGNSVTLKLNKKIRCNSLTTNGSEFKILPSGIISTAVSTTTCSSGFDFDEVIIALASTLPSGTHQLVINNGSDGNTLLDICGNSIPAGQTVSFDYIIPQPILADSIGKAKCSPDSVLIYFPKKIKCSSISASGSDFNVTGPTPVTVSGATGNCVNDLTNYIVVKLASPVYTKGIYNVSIQPGIDGSPVFDVCGQPILPQTLSFITADTVSALFNYTTLTGCLRDTFSFFHNGANDVSTWRWSLNNGIKNYTPSYTVIFPAISTNTVSLSVSNGTCSDTASTTISLNNEVKASFTMPGIICPEDKLEVKNTSTGQVDSWKWNYNDFTLSFLKDPPPFILPALNNREIYFKVKLIAVNNLIGCSDSTTQTVRILNNCFIAVPSAFTPNDDGLNDYFWPHNALKADKLDFKVFNRWGQLVFHSNDWRKKWDGKLNGILQGTGVYTWMLRYTNRDTKQNVFQKGTVTLIR